MNKRKKVLVLGAGFAGVYAYLDLLKHDMRCDCVEVTCVNKTDRFDFVVLAHEVATGGLLPDNTSQAIQSLPQDKDTDFMQAEVKEINFDTQEVSVERKDSVCHDGGEHVHNEVVKYDYLVMGLGSDVNDFNIPGVFDYALPLKDFEDAKNIKNKILESFETAQYCDDEELLRSILSFVVIGGGPTGVELVGEMSDFIYGSLAKIYPELAKKVEITLIQSGDRLLGQVDPWFHDKSVKILRKKKVHILFNKRVSKVTARTVEMGDESIASRNVYWTAGVKAREITTVSEKGYDLDERSRRVKVNNFLQVPNYPNVFVTGDQACVEDKETGQPYPMRAQFAVRQGVTAAQNIVADIHGKKLKEFKWKDQGFILSLGRGGALAEVFGFKISGPFAWWLYRTAYLMKLVGMRAKFRTGLEWAVNLVFSRDISKLS